MAAQELKRVRQLTCVGKLKCVERFKRVEKLGGGTLSKAQRKRKASPEPVQGTRHEQTSVEHAVIRESQGYADPWTKNPTQINTDSGDKSMPHKDVGQQSTTFTIPNCADEGFHFVDPNHAGFYEGGPEGSYFADPLNAGLYEGGLEGSYFADPLNAGFCGSGLEGSYSVDLRSESNARAGEIKLHNPNLDQPAKATYATLPVNNNIPTTYIE